MKIQHSQEWQYTDDYQFRITELVPVSWARVVDNGVEFWFESEDPDREPRQKLTRDEARYIREGPIRPLIRDRRAVALFREHGNGCEAGIRYLNRMIVGELLDAFEKIADTCPRELEQQYLDAIDRFYSWFWERRVKGDEKIFARFLRHLRHQRQFDQQPATWYTLQEAAAYLSAGVTKIRELISEGTLRAHRLDDAKEKSTILLHRRDLDAVVLFNRSESLTKRQQQRLDSYQK